MRGLIVASSLLVGVLGPMTAAAAVELGEEAPDFSLIATTGGKISLSQFRGRQPVLIEFYSADFAPA
jgi:hypothetical protein